MSTATHIPENCVRRVPFAKLSDEKISLKHGVPKCRLRFIDCRTFASREELRILEFAELPKKKYSAISYVWKGRKPKTEITPPTGWIEIDGAEGADKVCIDVLRLACETSLRLGCDLVWLDGLCIIQGNEKDRAWQIQHMYDIYASCAECIVIPGGLSRLVPLTEETNWIHRAWTLQEALAPPSSQCLFSWTGGSCHFQANFPVLVQEIEEGTAMASIEGLLQMSLKQDFQIIKAKSRQESDFKIVIFGNNEEQFSQIAALIGALDLRGQEGMANAVWRSSFMRTAKFPVDMVYSIMGLLGVTLDASKFKNEDRIPATRALMQEILDKGGRAEWLAIATRMEPNPQMSTIPVFPRYSSSGRAVVEVDGKETDACSLMDGWWMIQNAPTGTVDENNYLKIDARAAAVRTRSEREWSNTTFESVTLGEWEIVPDGEGTHYALQIGVKEQYTSGIFGMMSDPFKYALMLVKEHEPGKFSVDGYAFVEEDTMKASGGDLWSQRTFYVGGPGS